MIGSDSVVSVDGRVFDKPGSRDEAADHLRLFSGKAMTLTSAVALAREGKIDAQKAAAAVAEMGFNPDRKDPART